MEDMLKDSRFSHVAKDPKFRRIPKNERKVKIDKRFQSMFKDKKFSVKYTIDKRGRPVNQSSTDNLKKFYELPSSAEEESEDDFFRSDEEKDEHNFSSNGALLLVKKKWDESDQGEKEDDHDDDNDNVDQDESDKEDEEELENESEGDDLKDNEKQLHDKMMGEKKKLSNDIKHKLRDLTVDYARGEGTLVSESSSEEESSDQDEDEEDTIEHDWGEMDKETEKTDKETYRLAACNMDWDRIRAVDLMVLFNSFLPATGHIVSVTIYPSEFGLQRMKEEEINGPIELRKTKKDEDKDENSNDEDKDSKEENEEGDEYHNEKLRRYQLNRLKYYYAVIECDSAVTANKIYMECDGTEYESTATKLDLRFIPDDMTFDQEPKEVCDKLPDLSKYQPRLFTTTALQQVKVKLTWDETNPERREVTEKLSSGKIDDVNESDIRAYLASGSSSEGESEVEGNSGKHVESDSDVPSGDENEKTVKSINKYKSLLKSIEDEEEAKKKKDVELEFTWGLGTKEKTEKLVKERMLEKEDLTPHEKYLEKRKAKLKVKREERRKGKKNEGSESDSDSIPSGVDLNDPYFAEERRNTTKKSRKKIDKGENGNGNEDEAEEERRKAELELLLMDKSGEDEKLHFNMKTIEENETMSKSKQKRIKRLKKKGGGDEADDKFDVDVADPRFNAVYTSHHFNIDPADPHYRKTKGTEALIREKLKRRAVEDTDEVTKTKQPKDEKKKVNVELEALVKSVKRKTQKNLPSS